MVVWDTNLEAHKVIQLSTRLELANIDIWKIYSLNYLIDSIVPFGKMFAIADL